jgi:hypothetical protein
MAVNRIHKEVARYRVYFHGLRTPVMIIVWHDAFTNQISVEYSHEIKTPQQINPYSPDFIEAYDRAGSTDAIVAKMVSVMDSFYAGAVAAGHQPEEAWLVPVER